MKVLTFGPNLEWPPESAEKIDSMSDDAAKPDVTVGQENGKEQGKLQRELNAFDLTVLGVGGIVGAGIFVVSGEAAYKYAAI